MSSSFSRKFENFVDEVGNNLDIVGSDEQPASRFHKSAVSPGSIVAGDVLFFKYRSERFGTGDNMAMVIGNNRSANGIYIFTSKKGVTKKYLSAVKLNNIWSLTASLIIEAYRDKQIKYTSAKDDSSDPQKFSKEDSESGKSSKDNMSPTPENIKHTDKSRNERTKKSFTALVGRENYRTYILNNIWNAYEFGSTREATE
tara:strand:- start:35368 stop:35967 length:600 start_codon:yes stop_codon:yes gene_type:complete